MFFNVLTDIYSCFWYSIQQVKTHLMVLVLLKRTGEGFAELSNAQDDELAERFSMNFLLKIMVYACAKIF